MSNLQKKFPSLVRSRSENDCPMNSPQCGEVLAVRRRATSKNGTPRDISGAHINDPHQPSIQNFLKTTGNSQTCYSIPY